MRKVNIITFLLIIATIPLGIYLPKWVFWENNWVENMQALVLLGAFLFNMSWAMRLETVVASKAVDTIKKKIKAVFISEAVLFLVAFGREISWGRIFYPKGMGPEGPEFFGIKEVRFGPYLPWVLGIAVIILVYNLWRSRQIISHMLRLHKQDYLLRVYFVLFLFGLALSETVFEKSWISTIDAYHQSFEELFELIGYWSAFAISYRLKELFKGYR